MQRLAYHSPPVPIAAEKTVPRLPAEWTDHVADGVSVQLGSCSAAGVPGICRALGAELRRDGSMRVLVARRHGPDVLDAIADTALLAAVLSSPTSHRTLHVKGRDATVQPAVPADAGLIRARRDALLRALQPLGPLNGVSMAPVYDAPIDEVFAVCFSLSGAWNQTPGPGAGQPIELLP